VGWRRAEAPRWHGVRALASPGAPPARLQWGPQISKSPGQINLSAIYYRYIHGILSLQLALTTFSSISRTQADQGVDVVSLLSLRHLIRNVRHL